jgi:hypothetical protein
MHLLHDVAGLGPVAGREAGRHGEDEHTQASVLVPANVVARGAGCVRECVANDAF